MRLTSWVWRENWKASGRKGGASYHEIRLIFIVFLAQANVRPTRTEAVPTVGIVLSYLTTGTRQFSALSELETDGGLRCYQVNWNTRTRI